MPLDNIVKLEVGRNSDVINVDKGVLQFYSGYFRAALNGKFVEASKGIIKLPTEEFKIVDLAVTWMYRRQLNVEFKSVAYGEIGLLLCRLWVFADRREVPMLANAAIDELKRHLLTFWYLPSHEMVRFSYANTAAGAALRRFLVFYMAVTCSPRSLMPVENCGWPQEALLDLLETVWEGRDHQAHRKTFDPEGKVRRVLIQNTDMCEYHVHGRGVTCGIAEQKCSPCGDEG